MPATYILITKLYSNLEYLIHLLVRDIVDGVKSGESVPKDLQNCRHLYHIKYKRIGKKGELIMLAVNVFSITIIDS